MSGSSVVGCIEKGSSKFHHFGSLGFIVVPDKFDIKDLSGLKVDPRITNGVFPNPKFRMVPGEHIMVHAFHQITGEFSYGDVLRHLRNRHALHLGLHGAALVMQQKFSHLTSGHKYLVPEERPWKNHNGIPMVPSVDKGDLKLGLKSLMSVDPRKDFFLCFTDC